MSDYRHTVAFNAGTKNEKQVTFNAAAPTKTQGWAGIIARWILTVIGVGGCSLVWAASAYFSVRFVSGLFDDWPMRALWGTVAVGMDVVKGSMPIVIAAARKRGEIFICWTAGMLLFITAALSVVAGTSHLYSQFPLISQPSRSVPTNLAEAMIDAAGWLLPLLLSAIATMGIETVATFGFVTFLVGAKALQDTYDEAPAEMAETPVMLEPAMGSFEQGFSAWASENIAQDASGRLHSSAALRHYSDWARFNGPYAIPHPQTFGKTLSAHCQALGATATRSNGNAVYGGVALTSKAKPLSLPAAAQ